MNRPGFDDFGEQEIEALFKAGEVNGYVRGEPVFPGGRPGKAVFAVLEGSLQCAKNSGGRLSVPFILRPGEWGGDGFWSTGGSAITKAVAREPSKVLVIGRNGFDSLPADVRNKLLLKLLQFVSLREDAALMSETEAIRQRDALSARAIRLQQEKSRDYTHSEVIGNMILGIPRLPLYSVTLIQKLMISEINAQEISDILRRDPSLAGLVLKKVNSSAYGFQKQVTDLQHAVLLLGFNQILQMIIAQGVFTVMPKTGEFNELRFRSMAISYLTYEIASAKHPEKAPLYSTIGLLHNLGRSIVMLLMQKYEKLGVVIHSFDDAKLGAMLLSDWKLPDMVCRCVEMHRYPEFCLPLELPESLRLPCAAVYLAKLAYSTLKGEKDEHISVCFLEDYSKLMGIRESDPERLVGEHILPVLAEKLPNYPVDFQQFVKASGEDWIY